MAKLFNEWLKNNFVAPIGMAVQAGIRDGYSTVDKFGENPDIQAADPPQDIWEAGGAYPYDDFGTAPIVSLVSDNIADTQPIVITGLDIEGNEVVQVITLTGTTRVALDTPLWRVYRMINNADAGNDIIGNVSCYTGLGNAPLAGETRAIISNGNNQTLMALYTIPLGKVGFLFRGELGMSRSQVGGSAQCSYYSRRVGKVFNIKKRIDLNSGGNSIYIDQRSFPDVIPALTDIRLSVESVSNNSTGIYGAFDILLVDEDKLDMDYLKAIGQPGVI